MSDSRSGFQKFTDFIEQPLFLFAIGVLAGIMGLFFFAPILTVCGLCIVLAVHRSKIIGNWDVLPGQFCAYVTLSVITAVTLSLLNTAIQKKLEAGSKFPTPEEIASAVSKNLDKGSAPSDKGIGPAGMISLCCEIKNGQVAAIQENQTHTPLDNVHLSIMMFFPKADNPHSGPIGWQKEIELGTVRALLTTSIAAFPIPTDHDNMTFAIVMFTRYQTYTETIKVARQNNKKQYRADASFFGNGGDIPIFTRSNLLTIADSTPEPALTPTVAPPSPAVTGAAGSDFATVQVIRAKVTWDNLSASVHESRFRVKANFTVKSPVTLRLDFDREIASASAEFENTNGARPDYTEIASDHRTFTIQLKGDFTPLAPLIVTVTVDDGEPAQLQSIK